MKGHIKNHKELSKYIIIGIIIFLLIITAIVITIRLKEQNKFSHFMNSNDIIIRYAYGEGIQTVETMNKQEPYMDIVKITLKGKELTAMQKALKNNSFTLDKNIQSVGVAGVYEVINGDETFFLDQEEAIYTKDNKTFYKIGINTELFDTISDIVFNHVDKLQEKIKTNEITLTNKFEEQTYSNKETVDEIISYIRYVKLKSAGTDLGEEDIYLDFKNGIFLTTYMNTNVALYKNTNTNEECYVLLYSNANYYFKKFLSTEDFN